MPAFAAFVVDPHYLQEERFICDRGRYVIDQQRSCSELVEVCANFGLLFFLGGWTGCPGRVCALQASGPLQEQTLPDRAAVL